MLGEGLENHSRPHRQAVPGQSRDHGTEIQELRFRRHAARRGGTEKEGCAACSLVLMQYGGLCLKSLTVFFTLAIQADAARF